MIKKTIITISIFFIFSTNLMAAGSSSTGSSDMSKYDQAVKLINAAKKLEKKK